MAAVRRSTRINSVVKITSPSRTPKQLSEIWRLRQIEAYISDDDEDDILSSNDDNCENLNMLNTRNKNKTNKNTKVAVVEKLEEPKTPQSKRNNTTKKRVPQQLQSDESEGSEDEAQKVSPSKQARKFQDEVISPSRLLNRLSIDERKESNSSEDDKEKSAPPRNKFQNARRVLNSAETEKLPGREQQLSELRDFLEEHLSEQRSGSLYVSGPPGTGKTACLSILLRAPEFAQRLKRIYINCTSIASVGGVYKKLCAELQLQPNGRSEREYILEIQRYLRTSKRMLLIVLDEIDQLCSTKQAVLYTIFEWPAMPGTKLLLVGIANSLDLTDRLLVRLNARCELKPQLLHFPPYSKQQIVDIFKSRLEEAGVLDVFPPVTLQLLAAKVSAVSGDVRRALDIGRRVAEIAEKQMREGERKIKLNDLDLGAECQADTLQPVKVTQVAEVLNKVYGASQNLQDDIEDSFPLQQKITLCTLMLMLRKERNKDITIGRLHEVYRRVCGKKNIHTLDQAEFAGLVSLVETRGILRVVRKKEPRLSKVQLQWDEEEVNAALKDKQLIASILDDTSCLGK